MGNDFPGLIGFRYSSKRREFTRQIFGFDEEELFFEPYHS